MPITTVTFDGLAGFVDYAAGEASDKSVRRKSRNGAAADYGTLSYDEAEALAFRWDEGVEKYAALRRAFAPKGQKMRRQVVMREAGPGTLSMGHYLAGHPQPYATLTDSQTPVQGRGKIVRLELSLFVSSGVENEHIERRGGAVLALVDALERAGRSVEIYGNICITTRYQGKTRLNFRIRLKAAGERLNLPSLAFALAHPSMYRRLGFSAIEVHPDGIKFGAGSFYGYSAEPDPIAGAIVVPSLSLDVRRNWRSDQGAESWVAETLTAQGVTLA